MNPIKRELLHAVSHLFSERVERTLIRWAKKPLRARVLDQITDDILEILLGCMEWAFALSPRYRRNIRDLNATLVFRTRADAGETSVIAAAAQFSKGRMRVSSEEPEQHQAAVVFTDARALWAFLLSENQDILDSLLTDDIRVEKNLNYVYRFGFLARELIRS